MAILICCTTGIVLYFYVVGFSDSLRNVSLSSQMLPPGVARVTIEVDVGSTHTQAAAYRWNGFPSIADVQQVVMHSYQHHTSICMRNPMN